MPIPAPLSAYLKAYRKWVVISYILLFLSIALLLYWSLAVIFEDVLLSYVLVLATIAFAFILASLVEIWFILNIIRQAADYTSVAESFWDKFAQMVVHRHGITKMQQVNLGNIDYSLIRHHADVFGSWVRWLGSLWLCTIVIAVFRVLLREYNPIILILVFGLFISLIFKQKIVALAFGVLIGASFLLIDRGGIELPSPQYPAEPSPNPVPPYVVTVYGGSDSWVTTYTNVAFTNRFSLSNHQGHIRIATYLGDFVDRRGLLQENGAKYRLDNATHFLEAGITPDQWLLSDPAAAPFCLVGCITSGNELPDSENSFGVGHAILLKVGESLHFSYNRIVRGEYKDSFKNDSGYFRFRLIPFQDNKPVQ
jgi:hypothetical protein